MFDACLTLDGISIIVGVEKQDVKIALPGDLADEFYFSTTNAMLIAQTILAAVNEIEKEG